MLLANVMDRTLVGGSGCPAGVRGAL